MNKPLDLGISHSICLWIKNFLSDRSQKVKVVCHYSSCLRLSTDSPLLYTLYTHDCTPTHSSNTTIKFADDTTVVGLISGGDESSYRDEVEQLLVWCVENNLALNITKTKELIIDCRRKKTDIFQLHSRREEVKPRRLSDVPSPPWKTGTVPTVSGRPTIFSETHLPPDTLTLNCCPLADVTDQ